MTADGNPVAPTPAESPELQVADLPEKVQVALVSTASRALPEIGIGDLPAGLRRFVGFAPARRMRLAGAALVAALDDDASFRRLVAEAAKIPEDPGDGGGTDPSTLAVRLFLRRPSGWSDEVAQISEQLAPELPIAVRPAAPDRRLAAQLSELRGQMAEQRDDHRRQVKALKDENTTLRATVRAERDKATTAAADRARLTDELIAVRAAAAAIERRLQQKLTEAAEALAEARRTRRSERGDDSTRLRLLVDSLTGLAAGLRRELGLPAGPLTTLPADSVEMRGPGDGAAPGARIAADPGGRLLADRLALPQAHLIVDGYNVTKTAWPTTTLADQRTRLTAALSGLQSRTQAEVTAVFDGADLRVVPTAGQARGVRVRFSPPGVSADDVIRQLVAAEPTGRAVVVVTSDNAVATDVARSGATVFGSPALIDLIDRT